jgi:hypothetical protein
MSKGGGPFLELLYEEIFFNKKIIFFLFFDRFSIDNFEDYVNYKRSDVHILLGEIEKKYVFLYEMNGFIGIYFKCKQ